MVYAIFMSIDLIMQIGTRKGHEKRGTLDRFSMPLWTVMNIKVFMFMHWNLMNTFKLISTQRKHFLWNGDSRNSKKPRFPLCNPKCEKGHIWDGLIPTLLQSLQNCWLSLSNMIWALWLALAFSIWWSPWMWATSWTLWYWFMSHLGLKIICARCCTESACPSSKQTPVASPLTTGTSFNRSQLCSSDSSPIVAWSVGENESTLYFSHVIFTLVMILQCKSFLRDGPF